MARTEIRVGGLGGQGVILCAMIIGRAASIHAGRHATLIQAFGPEARGSACSAQLVVDDEPIGYPYVRRSDVFLAMSQDACAKFIGELKPGGLLLYEQDLVKPAGGPAGLRALGIPASRFAEEIGRRLVQNIVMAGFFTGATDVVPEEAMEKALRESIPAGTEDLNRSAFRRGYEYGRERRAEIMEMPR
jgi:2-oxoglutarate ferredoxin oxidoreductase subunit gamma